MFFNNCIVLYHTAVIIYILFILILQFKMMKLALILILGFAAQTFAGGRKFYTSFKFIAKLAEAN